MSRRKTPSKRIVLPDPKFNSVLVTKFINGLLRGGKRSVAETIFYDAIDIIAAKTSADGLPVFEKAMHNVRPMLEVRSRRVGGATYQVPVDIRGERQQALAIRWIINYAKGRSEKTMSEKLAAELMAAAKNEGNSIKKREDTHKMAEANKAFAHFRW
ncbi:MAG TPA: 30S ribosomal protein S7 [bacterium]|nr:30S ribosomal protein S7 [bacterium]HQG45165.1 30S ribosomal protein S7 [bacterium]HQI50110.1 30S ribosomal protein S7 [bacterium]HQJ66501.1 30S ribosomal protein S7 [bacterium]